ncbi:MAG: patatin-like phospholipase family protein [Peptoniphilaceae bacterium]
MYGLVLEGGGAKGAYHIGAFFALKELGYEFDAVVGTSIGALNGAMIAMGEAHKSAEVWKTASMSSFVVKDMQKDSEKEVNALVENIKKQVNFDLLESLKNIVIEKLSSRGISNEPLKNMVNSLIDEEKVRNSKMKFGLVTINLSDKRGEELFIDDIPQGQLKDYIIASCYLPVFKLEPINGKYYLDGGFYKNIPYKMVQDLGLTPIIIRVNPADYKDIYFPKDAIVIEPSKKYTSSMNFDPNKADEIMRIGYFDTYKKLKGLLGYKYYINEFSEEKAYAIMEDIYTKSLDSFLIDVKFRYSSKYRRTFEEILPSIAKYLGISGDYTYRDLLIKILEKEADRYKIDYLRIYDIDDLVQEILKKELKDESKKTSLILNDILKRIIK